MSRGSTTLALRADVPIVICSCTISSETFVLPPCPITIVPPAGVELSVPESHPAIPEVSLDPVHFNTPRDKSCSPEQIRDGSCRVLGGYPGGTSSFQAIPKNSAPLSNEAKHLWQHDPQGPYGWQPTLPKSRSEGGAPQSPLWGV